jgi:hypothetical protein
VTRIVTTAYRYKRPPKKRKAVALDVATVVITRSSGTLTMAGSPSGGSTVTVNGWSDTYTHLGVTSLESNDLMSLNTTTIGNGSWQIGIF